MTSGSRARLGLAGFTLVVLAACGSATSASSSAAATLTPGAGAPTAAAATPPPAQAASPQCPSGSSVGQALGVTLPPPTKVTSGGTPSLPPGASGVVCNYLAASSDVLVEDIINIDPAYVMKAEQAISARSSAAHFTPVSGVGDQAVSYSYALSGGTEAQGMLAIKGTTFVAVFTTRVQTQLSQIQMLVTNLLG